MNGVVAGGGNTTEQQRGICINGMLVVRNWYVCNSASFFTGSTGDVNQRMMQTLVKVFHGIWEGMVFEAICEFESIIYIKSNTGKVSPFKKGHIFLKNYLRVNFILFRILKFEDIFCLQKKKTYLWCFSVFEKSQKSFYFLVWRGMTWHGMAWHGMA